MSDPTLPGIPDKVFFRIGEASELVGVEAHVIRYWEAEFKVRTHRSDTGQRLYRRADIGRLMKIKRLLHDEGFTIAGARRALDEEDAPVGTTAPPTESGRLPEVRAHLTEARELVARLRARLAAVASEGPRH